MKKFLKISLLLMIVVGLYFAIGKPMLANALAIPPGAIATVSYNLYATDGYVELADGNQAYIYGFIGGRAGTPIQYQSSFCTGDGVGRTCAKSVNMPLAAVPAPLGGPWNGIDSQLAGNAQFPAPIIYATTSDIVEIRLKNLGVAANLAAPNDPHSIHLHGLDVDAANDGVPETSVGAVPANLCTDGFTDTSAGCTLQGGPAPGAGNVIVYMFTPPAAGTYMYHCHQEADIHVNMGMYGALVVYNPLDAAAATGPGQGMGGTLFGFQYDKDYIMLLSEFDVRGHADEEGTYGDPVFDASGNLVPRLVPANTWDPLPYNWALYQPQYWFINGLSFPNTIHAGFSSGYTFGEWIAAHPGYDPLITGSVALKTNLAPGSWKTPGEKVLIRVINMGFETQPMHMHGYHGKILGSDQRAWDWANKPGNTSPKNPKPPTAFGLGLEKNTLTIGSGETYEWLVDFGQQSFNSLYSVGTESCYDPATGLPVANAAGCTPIPAAGGNYIAGPTVTGIEGPTPNFDLAGLGTNQYFPFHNHDDYKATNNGVYPGGMFTMLVPTP